MANLRWIKHVRAYAKKHNITYMCAIGKASATYKKTKRTKPKPVKKPKAKAVKKTKPKAVKKEEFNIFMEKPKAVKITKAIEKQLKKMPDKEAKMNYLWLQAEKLKDLRKLADFLRVQYTDKTSIKVLEKRIKIKKEKAVITFQSFYRGEKGRKKARNKKISKIVDEGQKLFKDLRELKGKIETLENKKKGPKTIRKGGKDRAIAPDYKYWNERSRKAHAKNPFTKQDNENLKTLRKDYRKEMKKEKYKKFYNSLTEKDKIRATPPFYWGQY